MIETSDTPAEMGELLLERKQSLEAEIFIGLVFMLLGGIAVYIVNNTITFALASVFGGISIVALSCALIRRNDRTKFFEFGASQIAFGRPRSLFYRDVQSLSFSSTRHYVNGSYSGTTAGIDLIPIASRGLKPVGCFGYVDDGDHQLDRIRDRIVPRVAERLEKSLKDLGAVQWTDTIRLTATAMRIRSKGRLGLKREIEVAYSEIDSFTIRKGFFLAWTLGQKTAVVNEPVSAQNFFPGFLIFQRLHDTRAKD